MRLRAESFADHYSQARQFFNSQTVPEQRHIAMALTFELSKVETPVIRERMVAHLLNIDDGLAETVADKLGMKTLPKPADAAVATERRFGAVTCTQHHPERADDLRRPKDRRARQLWSRRRAAEETPVGDREGRRCHGGDRTEGWRGRSG